MISENSHYSKLSEIKSCPSCGGNLIFKPGSDSSTMICKYCHQEYKLQEQEEKLVSYSFTDQIHQLEKQAEKEKLFILTCPTCQAKVTFQAHIVADFCPYCDTNLIIEEASHCEFLKPHGVIPFKINEHEAKNEFKKWLSNTWLLPKDFIQSPNMDKLQGIYIPYWIFDTKASCYYEANEISVTIKNMSGHTGNGQTISALLPHLQTNKVKGHSPIEEYLNIFVPASHSLDKTLLQSIGPWDFDESQIFMKEYIAGYRTEAYSINLNDGFQEHIGIISRLFRKKVKKQLKGLYQHIQRIEPNIETIEYKHLLLPLWISSYRYKNRVYRFIINGQTGKVVSERPYDYLKIALLSIALFSILIVLLIKFYP